MSSIVNISLMDESLPMPSSASQLPMGKRKAPKFQTYDRDTICTIPCDCRGDLTAEISLRQQFINKHWPSGWVQKLENPVWRAEQIRQAEFEMAAAQAAKQAIEQAALGSDLKKLSPATLREMLDAPRRHLSNQVFRFHFSFSILKVFLQILREFTVHPDNGKPRMEVTTAMDRRVLFWLWPEQREADIKKIHSRGFGGFTCGPNCDTFMEIHGHCPAHEEFKFIFDAGQDELRRLFISDGCVFFTYSVSLLSSYFAGGSVALHWRVGTQDAPSFQ